ncbi:MAG: HAD family phosphatase [bacterium]|nr:HAD family phosphatase [bacterium]
MSNNHSKAVLFDFDGVLVDSLQNHFTAWCKVLFKFGINLTLEEIAVNEGEKAEESMKRFLREKKSLYLKPNEISELVQEKRLIYKSLPHPKVKKEAVIVLKQLKQSNYKLGLVSGSTFENIQLSLSDDLISFFDVCVSGDIEIRGKPYPDPFLFASEQLSIPPNNCYVIENAPLGIQAAKLAKMKVIGITTTLNETYLKNADYIVHDYNEILKIITNWELNYANQTNDD